MLQKFSFSIVGLVLAVGTMAVAMPVTTALPGQASTADQALSSLPATTVYGVPSASEVFAPGSDQSSAAIHDLSLS